MYLLHQGMSLLLYRPCSRYKNRPTGLSSRMDQGVSSWLCCGNSGSGLKVSWLGLENQAKTEASSTVYPATNANDLRLTYCDVNGSTLGLEDGISSEETGKPQRVSTLRYC